MTVTMTVFGYTCTSKCTHIHALLKYIPRDRDHDRDRDRDMRAQIYCLVCCVSIIDRRPHTASTQVFACFPNHHM
jgi:hypothetical protein